MDDIRSLRVVEIAEAHRRFISGGYHYQVCFETRNCKLSTKSMLVHPDLCDWITANTSHSVKVLDEDVWFTNEDEAMLCHMRFSNGC